MFGIFEEKKDGKIGAIFHVVNDIWHQMHNLVCFKTQTKNGSAECELT